MEEKLVKKSIIFLDNAYDIKILVSLVEHLFNSKAFDSKYPMY